jgi:SAM-dependent methyltransferase
MLPYIEDRNLFYTFFSKEFTNELFNKILKEKLNDIEFINWMLKHKKKNNQRETFEIKSICNNWTYIIEYLILKFKKINQQFDNIKYLDIGCGSGNKTNKISKELKLDYNNVYGADISLWGPYNQKEYSHKFNFVQISNDRIDLKDDSIDFATCILMLHHVKNLELLLKEIKRILVGIDIGPDEIMMAKYLSEKQGKEIDLIVKENQIVQQDQALTINPNVGSNSTFKCQSCEHIIDRDIGAARNICLRFISKFI